MKYWLLRRAPHYTDIHPSTAGRPWDYDKVFPDPLLKANDIVYLVAAYGELYGWGMVTRIEPYQDGELKAEAFKLTVLRSVLLPQVVPADIIKRVPALARLFTNSDRTLVELQLQQINSLNQLLRAQGAKAPADTDEPESLDIHLRRLKKVYEATKGRPDRLIDVREVLKEEISSEQEAWDSVLNLCCWRAEPYGKGGLCFYGLYYYCAIGLFSYSMGGGEFWARANLF